jgi:hypothetical protein
MRYQIVKRAFPAPSSGGGKYRRAVQLMVVDATNGIKSAYRRNDPTIVREWRNVDSRYDGPRSEYGQAKRAAEALVAQLNAQQEITAVTAS